MLVLAKKILSFNVVGVLATFVVDPPLRQSVYSILECCYT